MLQSLNLLSSNITLSIHNPFLPPPLFTSSSVTFPHRPTSLHTLSAHSRTSPEPWLAQVPEPTTTTTTSDPGDEGPIELPPPSSSIFATTEDPSPLQVTTSVLLTGAISVFLFRSLRRRAERAKEMSFRSSGAKKTLKEEALDTLKAITPGSVDSASPASPIQALLGAVAAGVIALILYKFTTTIEASLNRQTMSDNFSVRQITITIRTIINGLCYLATFVFGVNSVGLFLYSGQLAINSLMGDSTSQETKSKDKGQLSSPNPAVESPTDGIKLDSNVDQSSGDKQ